MVKNSKHEKKLKNLVLILLLLPGAMIAQGHKTIV